VAEARTLDHAHLGELLRGLAEVAEVPSPSPVLLGALGLDPPAPGAHASALLLGYLPPAASPSLDAEGRLGGPVAAEVAGFWRAIGAPVPSEPDGLAPLLRLAADLSDALDQESGPRRAALARVQATLLWDHLASWALPWAAGLEELGIAPYDRFARLLLDALVAELVEQPPPPGGVPGPFRHAPPDVADLEGTELLRVLVVPVRSGLHLGRAHLARIGAELGVGINPSGRAEAVVDIVRADPEPALERLAGLADERRDRLAGLPASASPARTFWTERLETTSSKLRALARAARSVELGGEDSNPQ